VFELKLPDQKIAHYLLKTLVKALEENTKRARIFFTEQQNLYRHNAHQHFWKEENEAHN
jgi:hypothetical protein